MLALSRPSRTWSDVPRWLVTNGDLTVGPVHTDLLVRGYLDGRIPDECRVREVRWSFWRPLDGIREIARLKRQRDQSDSPQSLGDAANALPECQDAGELLAVALATACDVLSIHTGLVHRYRDPVAYPVTSAVCGGSPDRLGDVIAATDPAYQAALRGRCVVGSPADGACERLIAERLQWDAPLVSVAMTPIFAEGTLVGMLELGKHDHAFRVDDIDELSEFAAAVARRLSGFEA